MVRETDLFCGRTVETRRRRKDHVSRKRRNVNERRRRRRRRRRRGGQDGRGKLLFEESKKAKDPLKPAAYSTVFLVISAPGAFEIEIKHCCFKLAISAPFSLIY